MGLRGNQKEKVPIFWWDKPVFGGFKDTPFLVGVKGWFCFARVFLLVSLPWAFSHCPIGLLGYPLPKAVFFEGIPFVVG